MKSAWMRVIDSVKSILTEFLPSCLLPKKKIDLNLEMVFSEGHLQLTVAHNILYHQHTVVEIKLDAFNYLNNIYQQIVHAKHFLFHLRHCEGDQ